MVIWMPSSGINQGAQALLGYKCQSRVESIKTVAKRRKIAENVIMWKLQLITLYCAVCEHHSIIEATTQRQSNNSRPQFEDEECITVYL